MSLSALQLRQIMRQWASGVSLVTSADGQARQGMTVSSFTSVSLDPALVLICLENVAATRQFIARTRSFAVSMLSQDQQPISDRFAGRQPELEDRFAGLELRFTAQGHPIPLGVLAYLDCRVVDELQAGTHTIFVADVLGGEALQPGLPLLYYDREYRFLGDRGAR